VAVHENKLSPTGNRAEIKPAYFYVNASPLRSCLLLLVMLTGSGSFPFEVRAANAERPLRSSPYFSPVVVDGGSSIVDISSSMVQFRDASNSLSVDRLMEDVRVSAFAPLDKYLDQGFDKATYWLRVPIRNNDSENSVFVFHTNYPFLQQVDVFQRVGTSQQILQLRSKIRHRHIAYWFSLGAGEQGELIVRIRTDSWVWGSFYLSAATRFAEYTQTDGVVLGLFYGLVVGLLLYHLLLTITTRSRTVSFLVLYCMSACLLHATVDGLLFQFDADLRAYNERILYFFTYTTILMVVAFSQCYLSTSHHYHYPLSFFAVCLVTILGACLLPFFSILVHSRITNAVCLVAICWFLCVALLRFKAGYKPAWVLIAASLAIIVSLYFHLMFPSAQEMNYYDSILSLKVGMALQIVILSIGQGQRVNLLKDEKLAAEREKVRYSYLAAHDSLTGLPNRMMFEEELARAVSCAKRYGDQFALLYMDLDGFKPINDNYGHDAGDLILVTVGERVNSVLRAGDHFARIGGDEFALLVGNVKAQADVETVMQKIIHEVCQPVVSKDRNLMVSTSIGAAFYPKHGNDAEQLLKNADLAMYEAKTIKGSYCIYTPAPDQMSLVEVKRSKNG